MSIISEITRLQNAKVNIKTEIENKGITVPSTTSIGSYNDLIDEIESVVEVSSIPTTKMADIIYNNTNNKYYQWDYQGLDVPICFTANEDGSTVTLGVYGSPSWVGNYSTDNINWTTYIPGTTGAITLTNIGDKVYFKGQYTEAPSSSNTIRFSMTGSIAASGNIMSLCSGDEFEDTFILPYNYVFSGLFVGCSALTTPPLLPAITLTKGCYESLFSNCSNLIVAPVLPATTMAENCYSWMFYKCRALTAAPKLPATVLASNCYSVMFMGCTSLITAPELLATNLFQQCYYFMFADCTRLVTVPKLSATTLVLGCYAYMFYNCESLYVSDTWTTNTTHIWTIPSTGTFTNTLSQGFMFTGCAGTRSSDSMAGNSGIAYTYYTQNEPV